MFAQSVCRRKWMCSRCACVCMSRVTGFLIVKTEKLMWSPQCVRARVFVCTKTINQHSILFRILCLFVWHSVCCLQPQATNAIRMVYKIEDAFESTASETSTTNTNSNTHAHKSRTNAFNLPGVYG